MRTVYGAVYLCFAIVMVIILTSVRLAEQASKSPDILVSQKYVSRKDFETNYFEITGDSIGQKSFNVAFGLSDRHDSPEQVEDPDYGMLLPFVMRREPSGVFTYEMLDWEPCTEDYLAQNMFPSEPRFESFVSFNIKKLKCLQMNGDPLQLFGNFDTPGSQMLSIFHSSCDLLNVATCASQDDVTEWLKHKYVLLYYTQSRIDETTGEVESYSTFNHLPINRFVNTNFRFDITPTSLNGEPYYSVDRLSD